jgi:hypothetical protein
VPAAVEGRPDNALERRKTAKSREKVVENCEIRQKERDAVVVNHVPDW